MNNSIKDELNRVITWQYDNSTNLIAIVMSLEHYYEESTEKFWDSWVDDVVNIDTATDFGLAVWGNILGVKRFVRTASGEPVSTELYRKILKARAKLLDGNASMKDYCEFAYEIFGDKVIVSDGLDMSLTFADDGLDGEELEVFTDHLDDIVPYPTGVHDNNPSDSCVFGLEDQDPAMDSDPQIGGLDDSTFAWKDFPSI